MSDLRPKHSKISLGGEEYGLLFSLNAIDEIQEQFDIPISQLTELLKDERKVFKVLKTLLTILINEAIDDENDNGGEKKTHVDEKYVGRKISIADIATLKDKIFSSFTNGIPKPEEGDEAPNATSGQQIS